MTRRCLLDTHVAPWRLAGDRRLGAATRRLIETSACAVSAVSLAELALKASAGTLRLPAQPLDECPALAGIAILGLTLGRVQSAARLTGHHAASHRLVAANARHSPCHGCALRLDRAPSGALPGHGRKTLSL